MGEVGRTPCRYSHCPQTRDLSIDRLDCIGCLAGLGQDATPLRASKHLEERNLPLRQSDAFVEICGRYRRISTAESVSRAAVIARSVSSKAVLG